MNELIEKNSEKFIPDFDELPFQKTYTDQKFYRNDVAHLCTLRIRFATLRHSGNVSGPIKNQQLDIKRLISYQPRKMTIDLQFIGNNKLVTRANMCASNFGNKILDTLTEEELKKFTAITKGDDTEDETYTCKELIEKVWDACVLYGYISQDYDVLGRFLDTLKIT